MSGIPKKIGHIWVGPYPAPSIWMKSWTDIHPDWSYQLFDNHALERSAFRTSRLIDFYMRHGQYAGAADLIRYELLFAGGGLIPGADSICLRPVDELFIEPRAYTVFEQEFLRGKLVSPIMACEPGNFFVGALIDRLDQLEPEDLREPWVTTGNLFVARMIEELEPDITIFPSYMFNPVHYTGVAYSGPGPVFACQLYGSTRSAYAKAEKKARGRGWRRRLAAWRDRRQSRELKQRVKEFERQVSRLRREAFDEGCSKCIDGRLADTSLIAD